MTFCLNSMFYVLNFLPRLTYVRKKMFATQCHRSCKYFLKKHSHLTTSVVTPVTKLWNCCDMLNEQIKNWHNHSSGLESFAASTTVQRICGYSIFFFLSFLTGNLGGNLQLFDLVVNESLSDCIHVHCKHSSYSRQCWFLYVQENCLLLSKTILLRGKVNVTFSICQALQLKWY